MQFSRPCELMLQRLRRTVLKHGLFGRAVLRGCFVDSSNRTDAAFLSLAGMLSSVFNIPSHRAAHRSIRRQTSALFTRRLGSSYLFASGKRTMLLASLDFFERLPAADFSSVHPVKVVSLRDLHPAQAGPPLPPRWSRCAGRGLGAPGQCFDFWVWGEIANRQ